jgi:hypothetical protein
MLFGPVWRLVNPLRPLLTPTARDRFPHLRFVALEGKSHAFFDH